MGSSVSEGSVKMVSTLSTSSKNTTDLALDGAEEGMWSARRAFEKSSAKSAAALGGGIAAYESCDQGCCCRVRGCDGGGEESSFPEVVSNSV